MFQITDRAALSEIRKREVNMDRLLMLSNTSEPDGADNMLIIAVFDGVGSGNGGEAADAAKRTIYPALAGLLANIHMLAQSDDYTAFLTVTDTLLSALYEADRVVKAMGEHCATTVSIAVVFREDIITVNLGDSPIYLLRHDGVLEPLYQCHNRAGEKIARGIYTPENVPDYMRSCLTRMIGGSGPVPDEPASNYACLGQNDLLLVGSDGALGVLPEQEMAELFRRYSSKGLEFSVDQLLRAVELTQSTDNFTIGAVRLTIK